MLEASRLKDEYHFFHFGANQGVTHYHDKNYKVAIDSLEKHVSYFEKNKDSIGPYMGELPFIYYYAGESYLGLNQPEKAIEYFKKVDTIFLKTESLFPTLKGTYNRLKDYYKEKKDPESQITYINHEKYIYESFNQVTSCQWR